MKPALAAISVAALLITFAERLPAPIHEESPPPKPKVVAKEKKDDQGSVEARTRTKSKQPPFAQFAGVWTGSTTGRFVADNGLDTGPASSTTTLTISNDGTIQSMSGGQANQYKASVSSDGHALIWPIQYSDSNGRARGQGSLRLAGSKTGLYNFDAILTVNGGGKAIMKGSGTLTKQ